MTITYAWSFPQFCTRPSVGELCDVVCTVHWRLAASDGVNAAEIYGSIALPGPDPEAFTDFDELEQATVEGWMASLLDVPALEAALGTRLAEEASPPMVPRAAPWT
jgi:hypothetical protein